ncbi:hypothetical protein BGX33_008645 [Mortierella sp. NVP41]|nr:hypothetical protein BGX33_008645 [Mortierella sp. NVP41]
MIRLFTCIALTLALTSSILVMAQDPSAVTAPAPVPVPVGCVVATPQENLMKGKPYEVELQNCQGSGTVKLRYGDVQSLDTAPKPACANVEFQGAKTLCTFTPTKAGKFSFSTVDASGVETYSGPFLIDPKPVVASKPPLAAPAAKAIKETGAAAAPQAKGDVKDGAVPAPQMKQPSSGVTTEGLSTHKAEVMDTKPKSAVPAPEAIKRALYDMTTFALL